MIWTSNKNEMIEIIRRSYKDPETVVQEVIVVETVKEIAEKLPDTYYNGRTDFRVILLETKKRVHVFFRYRGNTYHKEYSGDKIFECDNVASNIIKLKEEEVEPLYWKIYDEIIDDLGIK
jgi:hypothetical protein